MMDPTSRHFSNANGHCSKVSLVFSHHFQLQQSGLNALVLDQSPEIPSNDLESQNSNNNADAISHASLKNSAKTTDGLVGIEQSESPDPFSDPVLKYISDMLMDEDMEERQCMYQECSALQATIKPFYDILGENYPPTFEPSSSCSINSSQVPPVSTMVDRENFDKVLLCGSSSGKKFSVIQKEILQKSVQKTRQNGSEKGSKRGKKGGKQKEVVDLRALLIRCAQFVATNDNRGAQEILKQIRQHSGPYGDGTQRLAYYFAESLEARMSGTGGYLYTKLSSNRPSAAEILKAYHLYMVASPFIKVSHYFCNQTIIDVAENANCLHIVDFGILYGFQWPCLIQRLSARPNGPPKLRITGIDSPQPGYSPEERIEETGRRLTDYARSFGVPFEYRAIATKWEDIETEDLSLRDNEVLIVNCIYRMGHLMDETVVVESPRDSVFNKIRRMNPHIFIQGVVNGAYNTPFFVTRFREALFHYSAQFDVLETIVPRDHPERILIEKEIWGREVLNVVACEGLERVERPEAYKQWQIRTRRSGFVQLDLNQEVLSIAREKAKSLYHKDFVVDKDGKWMLLGWKGRIIYGLSSWRPSK
eukprot:Gb_21856 [translate_table: standard]